VNNKFKAGQGSTPGRNTVNRRAALVHRHVDGVIAVAHEPQTKRFFRGDVPDVLPGTRLGVGHDGRTVGGHSAEFAGRRVRIVGQQATDFDVLALVQNAVVRVGAVRDLEVGGVPAVRVD